MPIPPTLQPDLRMVDLPPLIRGCQSSRRHCRARIVFVHLWPWVSEVQTNSACWYLGQAYLETALLASTRSLEHCRGTTILQTPSAAKMSCLDSKKLPKPREAPNDPPKRKN
ncbi:Eukaryotic translation initiation factor 5A-2 [Platysternon megacephalum]|uniref:Eukaryotic translation initiation factor 5A-2 n=1 Tax=Platysternon megacephalum TaxID=55544 RepID=A0A4D9EMP8_9SAUR|nr:Eukaryotic translation initiation factor 5A-2 [Platysternon megacephalum]